MFSLIKAYVIIKHFSFKHNMKTEGKYIIGMDWFNKYYLNKFVLHIVLVFFNLKDCLYCPSIITIRLFTID